MSEKSILSTKLVQEKLLPWKTSWEQNLIYNRPLWELDIAAPSGQL